MPYTRTIASDDARRSWGQLLDAVQRGEVVIITRHGRPVVAIVSHGEYEQLLEDARLGREIRGEQEEQK